MTEVRAYRIFNEHGAVRGRFVTMPFEELDPGDVVIRVAYSAINYKDALAATGARKVVRRFPCVGGIDLAGTVVSSTDSRFREGDDVLAIGHELGVTHDGGYAEYCRVPAAWVLAMPNGMTPLQAIGLGTAGFAAGLAVLRMEHEGLAPQNGPVVVTGATGGVGSLAIDMLAGAGYRVVALTGKKHEIGYLKQLGAAEVMLRDQIDFANIKPLGKATWAGAIDNVGGSILAWIASTMRANGTIASIGLAASATLNTTVMPFILRGVSLLGIDSINTPTSVRARAWERIATDLRPRHLDTIIRDIEFDELPGAFQQFLDGKARGRTVVRIGEAGQ